MERGRPVSRVLLLLHQHFPVRKRTRLRLSLEGRIDWRRDDVGVDVTRVIGVDRVSV